MLSFLELIMFSIIDYMIMMVMMVAMEIRG